MPTSSNKRKARAPRTVRLHSNVARVPEIVERLDVAYGVPEWRPHRDPVSELVLTILSQNTSDANSGRAFVRLMERFSSWDEVAAAPLPELIATIQPGGLAPTKAPRIQAALRDIAQRGGGFDLSFLAEVPLEDARVWLRSIHGVGPKTVACVLLFALGRPAMPVDTHVFRVAARLSLIPPRAGKAMMTAEKAHELLEARVPAKDVYAFHIGLIKHGRRVCIAQRPHCAECVLNDLCPSARKFHPELGEPKVRTRRLVGTPTTRRAARARAHPPDKRPTPARAPTAAAPTTPAGRRTADRTPARSRRSPPSPR